jgi:hypothetical protein
MTLTSAPERIAVPGAAGAGAGANAAGAEGSCSQAGLGEPQRVAVPGAAAASATSGEAAASALSGGAARVPAVPRVACDEDRALPTPAPGALEEPAMTEEEERSARARAVVEANRQRIAAKVHSRPLARSSGVTSALGGGDADTDADADQRTETSGTAAAARAQRPLATSSGVTSIFGAGGGDDLAEADSGTIKGKLQAMRRDDAAKRAAAEGAADGPVRRHMASSSNIFGEDTVDTVAPPRKTAQPRPGTASSNIFGSVEDTIAPTLKAAQPRPGTASSNIFGSAEDDDVAAPPRKAAQPRPATSNVFGTDESDAVVDDRGTIKGKLQAMRRDDAAKRAAAEGAADGPARRHMASSSNIFGEDTADTVAPPRKAAQPRPGTASSSNIFGSAEDAIAPPRKTAQPRPGTASSNNIFGSAEDDGVAAPPRKTAQPRPGTASSNNIFGSAEDAIAPPRKAAQPRPATSNVFGTDESNASVDDRGTIKGKLQAMRRDDAAKRAAAEGVSDKPVRRNMGTSSGIFGTASGSEEIAGGGSMHDKIRRMRAADAAACAAREAPQDADVAEMQVAEEMVTMEECIQDQQQQEKEEEEEEEDQTMAAEEEVPAEADIVEQEQMVEQEQKVIEPEVDATPDVEAPIAEAPAAEEQPAPVAKDEAPRSPSGRRLTRLELARLETQAAFGTGDLGALASASTSTSRKRDAGEAAAGAADGTAAPQRKMSRLERAKAEALASFGGDLGNVMANARLAHPRFGKAAAERAAAEAAQGTENTEVAAAAPEATAE